MSTIRVDNFGPSAGGTTYSADGIAKAWCYYGTVSTTAIRDSLNVTSLTDNGSGDTDINLTNAFFSADYAVATSLGGTNSANVARTPGNTSSNPNATGSTNILTFAAGVGIADAPFISMAAFGDLA